MACATVIQTAAAGFITYGWSYSRGGVDLVHGTLDALGVDSQGFLEYISNVGMTIRTTGEEWTAKVAADAVTGWFSAFPRIPADGSTSEIELHFAGDNGGFPVEFLMFHYPGFGAPYHSDVIFTDADHQVRSKTAESLSSVEWQLWQIPTGPASAVTDGGSTLALLVLPITAFLLCSRRASLRPAMGEE